MPVLKILPYKPGSASAKLLSQHLQQLIGKKVWRVRPTFKPKAHHRIINWGSRVDLPQSFNKVGAAAAARNKLTAFSLFKQGGVPAVEWTRDKAEALKWFAEKGVVYARHSLEGQGGAGIQIFDPSKEDAAKLLAQNAPLYTKFFSAKAEYRVHVAFGEVIDYARKKKKHDREGNKFLRNLENGYVYARVDVALPGSVADAAKKAILSLGLDFGAVDVLHNESKDIAAVLEVNTAPGLDNHTAERYARAFVGRVARV